MTASVVFGGMGWSAPVNLLEGMDLSRVSISGGGKRTVIPVTGKTFAEAMHAVNPEKKARSWDVGLTPLTTAPVRKDDNLLLIFYARGSSEGSADGKASFSVLVQKNTADYFQNFTRAITVDTGWKRFAFSFVAKRDFDPGDLKIPFTLGGLKQEVDIGGLSLLDFGPGEEGAKALAAAMGTDVADVAVDFTRAANMGFADDEAGNGKGGWSDQGPKRDLALFDFKQTMFGDVNFKVLDPSMNGGKSILVFKSSHIAPAVSQGEVKLATAKGKGSLVYLLHATAWCGPEGQKVGSVTVKLKSGVEKMFPVVCRKDVGDWVGAKAVENGAVVGTQSYPNGYAASLYLSAYRFSEVTEEVESVSLKSEGESIWMVVGVTLSSRDADGSSFSGKKAMVIKPHRPINLPLENPPPELQVQGGFVIASPKPSTTPVVNPGKGWVLYGEAEKQPAEVLVLGSLGYGRFQWGDLEPEEGKYDWSRIDKALAGWSNAGKEYSFGVMNASTHSKTFWTVPKWVFDAGAKYSQVVLGSNQSETSGVPGPKLVPVFDDPIFLEKLGKFLKALAARYDGHPNLAFIDIRSYGNWGESHMGGLGGAPDISPEMYKRHLLLHKDAFKKTLLSLCCGRDMYEPIYKWCVTNGITMRRDGICGNSDGSDVLPAAGLLPAVFEFYGSYGYMKKLGWWDGKKDANDNGYRLADCVEIGQATWCDLSRGGNGGLELLKAEPVLVAELANRLGYHIVIREGKWPEKANSGKLAVQMKWENLGVAPMFLPVTVRYALVDAAGKVVATAPATASKRTDWKSGVPVTVEDVLEWKGIPSGAYQLAVGLLREGSMTPDVKIAIEAKVVDGWQVLGPVEIR